MSSKRKKRNAFRKSVGAKLGRHAGRSGITATKPNRGGTRR